MNSRSKHGSVAEVQDLFSTTVLIQEENANREPGYDHTSDVLGSLKELADPAEVLSCLGKIDWSFTRDKTNYLSHDIHPYPAKFIPQIPRNLIVRLSLRGELVWDPFGGSGTTALEAILLGRRAMSTDVNPLSEIIGRGKTLTLTKEEEDRTQDFIEQLVILSNDRNGLRRTLDENRSLFGKYTPEVPNIGDWFHRNAVDELAYLRWRIDHLDYPKTQALARVCYSKSILKASFQDEETRYARRPREVSRGSVIQIFAYNLATALKKVRALAPLLRFREADFRTADLREPVVGCSPSCVLAPNSVDLVVTSPPYPNSNDYHLYHRFRLFWLGYDPREFGKREIGSHLRHQREDTSFESYLDEIKQSLQNVERALRPGRYAVLVVGDAVYKGKTYGTAEYVGDIGLDLGLEFVGTIRRTIHTTKRSFVGPARRAFSEALLVLRKPLEPSSLTLLNPPYKLWEFENRLRLEEIQALLDRRPSIRRNKVTTLLLNPLKIDRIKRLTFTHGFVAANIHREPTWQAIIENGEADAKSRRKDPKYATHGIHDYKGKFYPQLAKSLFNIAKLEAGQEVLDPFCGSGTVLLEGYLNGLKGFGVDMNPLAIKISRAKIGILDVDPYLRDRLMAKIQDRLDQMENDARWLSIFPENLHDELLSWFPKSVISKLGWLINEISYVPEGRVREFLEVLVSSIVRQVSHQDPRDLRIRRRSASIKDAPVRELFESRLSQQRKRLQQFAERCTRAPCVLGSAIAVLGDSRDPNTFKENGLSPRSVDAIVTSPPYATALPYIDTDRLSILLLLGIDSAKRSQLEERITGSREIRAAAKSQLERKIDDADWGTIDSVTARSVISEVRKRNTNSDSGFRRQNMPALLYRYFTDMTTVMRNLDDLLKPGAFAFFVIGDTKTEAGGKTVLIRSGQVLQETAESLGWDVLDVIPISVTTENRPHNKHSITSNDIIWFKKHTN
jgi:DNA modification methylase